MESVNHATDGTQAGKFRDMIKQKEVEIQALTERQYVELEIEIAKKEEDLEKRNQEFQRLQHDFKYNLQLLRDRDDELRKYDALVASQKAALEEKDYANRELRAKMVDIENTVHDIRVKHDAAIEQVILSANESQLTAKNRERKLEQAVEQLKVDMRQCQEEFARRLAEKDAALSDQHRAFADNVELQVRHFDQESARAEEIRKQQGDIAEQQICRLQRDMCSLRDAHHACEEDIVRRQDQCGVLEEKLAMLTTELAAEQMERDREAIHNAEIQRETNTYIDELKRDLAHTRADAATSLEYMEAQMQQKARESLKKIRILAEESKAKHRSAQGEAEKRLVYVEKMRAEELSRYKTQIEHLNLHLSQKEKEFESAIQQTRKYSDEIDARAQNDKMAVAAMQESKASLEEKTRLCEELHIKIEADKERDSRLLEEIMAAKAKEAEHLAEIELSRAQMVALRRDEENYRNEVLDLTKRLEKAENHVDKVGDDFNPLWSGDFGPSSPISWLRQTGDTEKATVEIEKLAKQNEDLRAAISRMTADAQKLDSPCAEHVQKQLRDKEIECNELRQRNVHLKQEANRLALERAQLMELSNTLRADILRQPTRLDHMPSNDYDEKITAIEASIKDLAAQTGVSSDKQLSDGVHAKDVRARTKSISADVHSGSDSARDTRVVGRSVSPSERKTERITSSARMTHSQTEKLRAIQRRRRTERERVRNWNDFK